LEPDIRAFLDLAAAAGGPALGEMTPAEAREMFRFVLEMQGEPEDVALVRDLAASGPDADIPLRLYRPPAHGPLPVLLYMHGGGWVIGDLETHDRLCRAIANAAGCAVVAVDYRLAPEHRYPAASEDCYAALTWLVANADDLDVDATRIAVGGDSAGGHLSAVVAQMARDRGGPALTLQILHCPVADADFSTPSYEANADGFGLTRDSMRWFWDHYLPDAAARAEPMASPLQGDCTGLPPALVQTAGYDPLRDEGLAYAAKLAAAGVEVTIHNHAGLTHDTLAMFGALDGGRRNLEEVVGHLRRAFGG
jgi:acetyl esterase